MQIGPVRLSSPVVLAPMAGISDRPFRMLCRSFGAAMAVSEMVTSDVRMWATEKSRHRLNQVGEDSPRVVQIAGADPLRMAEAARHNVELGADVIDINMGCPAKKVCRAMAGSALLGDELLVGQILEAVVNAVPVPVTLKIRTGLDLAHRNGPRIASIAESAGIQALAVHGRTRACGFKGDAEYDTIRAIKEQIKIPVIANGDIRCPETAARVLASTGADAIMIGRGALGGPWIFRDVIHFLKHKQRRRPPPIREVRDTMLTHLEQIYTFYGTYKGVRMARKHLRWYLSGLSGGEDLWRDICHVEDTKRQKSLLLGFLDRAQRHGGRLAA